MSGKYSAESTLVTNLVDFERLPGDLVMLHFGINRNIENSMILPAESLPALSAELLTIARDGVRPSVAIDASAALN